MQENKERRRVCVKGIVQGVGFRPFVYNLATKHQLVGFVTNTPDGVEIEVEGLPAPLNAFIRDLKTDTPPLADINKIIAEPLVLVGDTSFTIQTSEILGHVTTLISPDIATCKDCLAELFDSEDRRYQYPFINCTNCGPRYTIIENIPYDRPQTSMRHFTMCEECRTEYDDPADRRFHAQPNGCHVCGPQVSLADSKRKIVAQKSEAIPQAIEFLQQGKILAIKGMGGFHLVVDATSDTAVSRLRQRKGREEKPFAIMVPDLQTAQNICQLNDEEKQLLASCQSPIVLGLKKKDHGIAESVAPHSDRYGIMLPYTPLHHLLFASDLKALVMTSANFTEEPICIDNEEAYERLGTIADYFLTHDRDIYLSSDDSVVLWSAGKTRMVRRSRGYAPRPIALKNDGPPVLGVGGELKNTVCFLKDQQAIISQHIGDLHNLEAYIFFQKTISHLKRIFETKPELVVHDLHPGYLSTQWAKEQNELPVLAVQHHHAHLAACLAENQIGGSAIGLIMDGTGYGADGTIWGGEILIGDCRTFQRYGCFEPMPLPGGDIAIKEPWRIAAAYLYKAFDGTIPDLPFLQGQDYEPVLEIVAKNINSPLTSSCGRLFDAVAAMSGGRQFINYEAQAAIEFMQAGNGIADQPFSFEIEEDNGIVKMSVRSIIQSVVQTLRDGSSQAEISQRFHRTLIDLLVEMASKASNETGIKLVVLSGGVFQNHILFEGLICALEKTGLQVVTHSEIPTNDGCVSFGQAVIGREHLLN